jgi:hypothetical protein
MPARVQATCRVSRRRGRPRCERPQAVGQRMGKGRRSAREDRGCDRTLLATDAASLPGRAHGGHGLGSAGRRSALCHVASGGGGTGKVDAYPQQTGGSSCTSSPQASGDAWEHTPPRNAMECGNNGLNRSIRGAGCETAFTHSRIIRSLQVHHRLRRGCRSALGGAGRGVSERWPPAEACGPGARRKGLLFFLSVTRRCCYDASCIRQHGVDMPPHR